MIKRNRTSSRDIGYGLYLYFLGLSTRNVAKALSFLNIVKRRHVSIWNWIQKYQPKRISSQRNKIDELIVDEAVIKVGSELIWLWVAIDSKNKQILAQNISPKRETCLLQSAFCQILFENMESIRFQQMEGLGIHKPVCF
jgi:putative transposase